MSPTLELCVCIFGGPGCLGLTSMLACGQCLVVVGR